MGSPPPSSACRQRGQDASGLGAVTPASGPGFSAQIWTDGKGRGGEPVRERLGGGPTGRWRQACSRAPGWCWAPAPGKQMATGRGLRGTRGLQGQRFSLSWGPGSQPLIPDFHNHASFLTRGPFKLISIQEGMKAVNGNLAKCLTSCVAVEFSRQGSRWFRGWASACLHTRASGQPTGACRTKLVPRRY